MMSLDSSPCPLSIQVVCLYIISNCKLLDASEGKELFLKGELPSRGKYPGISVVGNEQMWLWIRHGKESHNLRVRILFCRAIFAKTINPNHKEPCRGICQTKLWHITQFHHLFLSFNFPPFFLRHHHNISINSTQSFVCKVDSVL